jgi:hypothetical protein
MFRLAFILCILAVLNKDVASAKVPSSLTGITPCANVTLLNQRTMRTLPSRVQSAIRIAVRPGIQAIVSDKGMGMESTVQENVPLNAIQIGRGTLDGTLYIVSWDDSSFGVNGAIWIVEVTSKGAKNLMQLRNSQSSAYSLGGFGFEVLSPRLKAYPEVMIASSGFKEGGGAEAEEVCVRKTGDYYKKMACPVTCHEALNKP